MGHVKDLILAFMHFDNRVRLYAAGQAPFELDEFEGALNALGGAPWVLVVGDVEEPTGRDYGESTQLRVHELEQRLGLRCMVFGWCDGPFAKRGEQRSLALRQARASALGLARIIAWLAAAPPGTARPSMLVDGLGAMVLEHVVTQNLWVGLRAFSTVVLAQPDCSALEHAKWLEPIGLIEQVYVLWHGQDEVLEEVARDQNAAFEPLGLGTVFPLASTVAYIDVGVSDACAPRVQSVFGGDQVQKASPIAQVVVQALSGRRPLLLEGGVLERTRRARVWKLREAGHI